MLPHIFESPGDLLIAVGQHFGPTDWIAVDQAKIDKFAEGVDQRLPAAVDDRRRDCDGNQLRRQQGTLPRGGDRGEARAGALRTGLGGKSERRRHSDDPACHDRNRRGRQARLRCRGHQPVLSGVIKSGGIVRRITSMILANLT